MVDKTNTSQNQNPTTPTQQSGQVDTTNQTTGVKANANTDEQSVKSTKPVVKTVRIFGREGNVVMGSINVLRGSIIEMLSEDAKKLVDCGCAEYYTQSE